MELSEVKTSRTSKSKDLKNNNDDGLSYVSKDIIRNSNEAGPSFLNKPFLPESDGDSVESKEIALNSLDFNTGATTSFAPVHHQSTSSVTHKSNTLSENSSLAGSPRLFSRSAPTTDNITITSQPRRGFFSLPSPTSINITKQNHPRPLFLLALSKLNESNLSLTVLNQLSTLNPHLRINSDTNAEPKTEIPAPDSLTSAPPSYSFVLRQIANRRRPRLMGTFIPSPSFVQHTPPPNYAAAFDIYVDNPIPPPPPRVFNFGFAPMPIVCPECGYTGLTSITTKITICTHLCAVILCLFCCWVCVPLPYILRSCKDVYHYCRSCRSYLGMYCPTNPENTYP